jgi:hypothetical protein
VLLFLKPTAENVFNACTLLRGECIFHIHCDVRRTLSIHLILIKNQKPLDTLSLNISQHKMNTPTAFSAFLLFFTTVPEMAIAQEAANKGGHFLRTLNEESFEPFLGSMSMSADGIIQEKVPFPSINMANALSKADPLLVKAAEALSGQVAGKHVVPSDSVGKFSEGVSATEDDCADGDFQCEIDLLADAFFAFVGDTCIYPTPKNRTLTPKSGKSGKSSAKSSKKSGSSDSSESKIKRFQVESALEVGVLAPATIHGGKMYSPGIRNSLSGEGPEFEEGLVEQILFNLFILENYLTCVGTKIEDLLTIKFYLIDDLIGEGPEIIFLVILIFLQWWLYRGGFPGDDLEEYLGGNIENLLLLLPTINFVFVPAVLPPLGGFIGGDVFLMIEAVAAV